MYRIFKEKVNGKGFIEYGLIKEILRRRLHEIRRELHYRFLNEMEELKLIRRYGNTKSIKYELIGKDIYKLLNLSVI